MTQGVDDRVSVVLRDSVAVAWADRLIQRGCRAMERSVTRSYVTALGTWWQALPWAERRRAVGTTLMTAVIVHVGLAAWEGASPGWLWLILPGMAAAVGGLLIAASGPSRETP
ncbi:MAG: hypothetical protein Q7R30_16315 [Acidobacteriota bacterium]|nr:hypothetical protein [Acidobacteriota bacterium]